MLPASIGERSVRNGTVVQALIAIVATVLIAIALVPTIIQAFMDRPLYYPEVAYTLKNFVLIFTDPEIRRSLWATLIFAAITVTLSMVVGTGSAILLARTDMPGRSWLGSLALWPLYLSPQVIGIGAIIAYGPSGIITLWVERFTGIDDPWNLYSVTGIAIITAIANAPITTLYCIVAARQQDPNHDAAARVAGGGTVQILQRIIFPLMRPALIFALIMNIANAVETLAIPLIIGGPVNIDLVTTLIYKRSLQAGGIPQYGLVATMAILMVAFIGILFLVQRLLLRKSFRFIGVGPKAGANRRLPLGRWKWAAFGLLFSYVSLGIIVIVGAVFVRSGTFIISPHVPFLDALTPQNYIDLLTVDVYRRSIFNTIILALIGAALGTALIAAISLVAQRSQFRFRRSLDALAQIPRVVPGIIVGLGVFYASVYVPLLSEFRNTIWLLLLAYLIRFLSAGYGIVSPSLLLITPDFDKAAKTVGAGWSTTMVRIVVPLQRHALLTCFVLLMILIIKEYSSAVFLMAPGSEVIGSTMLSLWEQGFIGPVSALAVVQIMLTVLLVAVASRLFGVRIYG